MKDMNEINRNEYKIMNAFKYAFHLFHIQVIVYDSQNNITYV
jgi:hypothetical protein